VSVSGCPHLGLRLTAAATATGRPLDLAPLSALIGAAWAGCRPCQLRGIDLVLDGPPEAVAHLAGMTWLGLSRSVALVTARAAAGIPAQVLVQVLDRFQPATRDVFRSLNLQVRASDAYPPSIEAAYRARQRQRALEMNEVVCRRLTRPERRQVVEDCLDILTGLMATRVVELDV
jgi:hypothetical protein